MKALVVFGTRPEAIKLAPLIAAMREDAGITPTVCVTAQHRQLLDQVLGVFGINPDIDLDLMRPGQALTELTAAALAGMRDVLESVRPDLVVVQGDTTTAFAAGLAAFYQQVAVAHVEAGLRTGLRYTPFPEELNRKLLSCLSQWHFVPTTRAREALLREGYPAADIHVVGNTVIDALMSVREAASRRGLGSDPELGRKLAGQRFVLVTGHRRESFGAGFLGICQALGDLAALHPDVHWVYPVHLNPQVSGVVHGMLGNITNIHLIPPVDYLDFVWLMNNTCLIITDSGGVQEEAPALGKPVLIMRDTTERPEVLEAGAARLVGTDRDTIRENANRLLTDTVAYDAMAVPRHLFGDGSSSRRIVEILRASTAGRGGR